MLSLRYFLLFFNMLPLSCLRKFLDFYFMCFSVFYCVCIHEVARGFFLIVCPQHLPALATSNKGSFPNSTSSLISLSNKATSWYQKENNVCQTLNYFCWTGKMHWDWKWTAFWSSERKHSQCLWFWLALSSSQKQNNLNKTFVKNKTQIHHVACKSIPTIPSLEILL